MKGAPIEISDGNFETEVLQSKVPVLVDFWAEWCGPCKMVAPVVHEIAVDYAGKIKVGKINVDNYPEKATQYSVRGIPTLLLFKQGKVSGQIVGAVPKKNIVEMVEKVLKEK